MLLNESLLETEGRAEGLSQATPDLPCHMGPPPRPPDTPGVSHQAPLAEIPLPHRLPTPPQGITHATVQGG